MTTLERPPLTTQEPTPNALSKTRRPRTHPLAMAALLVLIAVPRILGLSSVELKSDDVWSAWQVMGSPAEIVGWTPYDWAPLYYLLLGGWQWLVGETPLALRMSSVLASMLGAAFTYRFMRRLAGENAAVMSMLAYGALAYSVRLGFEIRSYALVVALTPLLLWLMLRYFDRMTWQRGVQTGVVIALMFNLYLPSAITFVAVGLLSALTYGRRVWRWWLPSLVAFVLCLPLILNKLQTVATRTDAVGELASPPFGRAMLSVFEIYTGNALIAWGVLLLLAVGLLAHRRKLTGVGLALVIWLIAGPVVMYLLNPVLGLIDHPRYFWWVMTALMLLVGWGLSYLPQVGRYAAGVVLLGVMFVPVPHNIYAFFTEPYIANFSWLSWHIAWGDVVVIDPNNECIRPMEWDYFTDLYFPHGLQVVDDPADYRRVWYVTWQSRQDADLEAAVQDGRVAGRFVGPPECLFRLYEAPPDSDGVLFENGMRFHGADVIEDERIEVGRVVRREGESVRLRLWWSVDAPPERDYSVTVQTFYQGDGSVITQDDSAPRIVVPTDAPTATSQWQPGAFYVEERVIDLPFPTSNGSYDIRMAVYFWEDGVRQAAPGVDENGLLPLREFVVRAW